MESLETQQEHLADQALASYNFGEGVTMSDSGSWSTDNFDGEDEWIMVISLDCEGETESRPASFHVKFEEGTIKLNEAYAYSMKNGSEIGSMGE